MTSLISLNLSALIGRSDLQTSAPDLLYVENRKDFSVKRTDSKFVKVTDLVLLNRGGFSGARQRLTPPRAIRVGPASLGSFFFHNNLQAKDPWPRKSEVGVMCQCTCVRVRDSQK